MLIDGCCVVIRWRNNLPNNGYDLWDGDKWVPITDEEYQSYTKRGLSVHTNPPWANRG